jgi:hypothetical protein
MADHETDPPRPSPDRSRETEPPSAGPPGADDQAARVRQQRRHIEDLTGQDPLRGGIDD